MERSIARRSAWSSLLLFFVLSTTLGGCRRPPCDDDFKAGERFQITILSQKWDNTCRSSIPSLSAGDAFTLIAGPAVKEKGYEGEGETYFCNTRGALADAPPFLTGTLTSCATAEHRLGLMCTGADAAGCGLSVTAQIYPIPGDATLVEHGTYAMTWTGDCDPDPCSEYYDVRIERLDALPGGER